LIYRQNAVDSGASPRTESLADALACGELVANTDQARYERAALRWLQRFIHERLPPVTEVALAAAALAELRHGKRNTGVEASLRIQAAGWSAASSAPSSIVAATLSKASFQAASNSVAQASPAIAAIDAISTAPTTG
jgi:hypothetical protein